MKTKKIHPVEFAKNTWDVSAADVRVDNSQQSLTLESGLVIYARSLSLWKIVKGCLAGRRGRIKVVFHPLRDELLGLQTEGILLEIQKDSEGLDGVENPPGRVHSKSVGDPRNLGREEEMVTIPSSLSNTPPVGSGFDVDWSLGLRHRKPFSSQFIESDS
jgi:hypothetical protein